MQKILNNGNICAIVDTLGGELISYKNNNKEYIWSGDAEYWTGHAPVLFPIVGVLRNDKVTIEGGEYSMARHGFARKSEFTLAECTDSKAVFELVYNEETLKQYPYKFKLIVTHEICEIGFKTDYKVINLDDKPIMFGIGGHAGFAVDSIENYKLIFDQPETCQLYYTDKSGVMSDILILEKGLNNTTEIDLHYVDFDVDVIIADKLKSRKVKLVRKTDGSGIEFDYTGFEVLGVWTPPGKRSPFICLEPWNGMPASDVDDGLFEHKPYIITLDVNGEYEVGYNAKII